MTEIVRPRVALHVPNHGNAQAAVNLAVTAEEIGIREVWLSEDIFYRGVFTVAGAIAARTTTLRIGIGIVSPATRHPVTQAMELRSLIDIAGDRLTFGVSGGVRERVAKLGVTNYRPADTMRDTARVIHQLLLGRSVTNGGVIHTTTEAALQGDMPPRPPEIFGAGVAKRSLKLIGEYFDGALFSIMNSYQRATWAASIVHRSSSARGLTHFPIVGYVPFAVSPDGTQARAIIARLIVFFIDRWRNVPHLSTLFTEWSDIDNELMSSISERVRADQDATSLIPEAMLRDFAICGDDDDCRAGLNNFLGAGLDTVALNLGSDAQRQQHALSWISNSGLVANWR